MSFWKDLGEAALHGLAAAGSTIQIQEWLGIRDHDERDEVIARFVRRASKEQIDLAFRGFEVAALGTREEGPMKRLLSCHFTFAIEVDRRFG